MGHNQLTERKEPKKPHEPDTETDPLVLILRNLLKAINWKAQYICKGPLGPWVYLYIYISVYIIKITIR